MAWDVTQQPWLVTYPQPARPTVYATGSGFVTNVDFQILPPPPFKPSTHWFHLYQYQPNRKVVNSYNLGDFFAFPQLNYWKPVWYADSWGPTWVEPARTVVYAAGTNHVGAVWFRGVDYNPAHLPLVSVQPGRPIVYAKGTDFAWGQWFRGVETTADRWQPVFVQPSRTPQTILGTIWAAGKPPSIETSIDKWQPVLVQPGRSVVYAKGSDFAIEISMLPGIVPIDRWQSVYVQPNRPALSASGMVANTLRFVPDPYIDRWQPIYVQPGRFVVYARGTEAVLPPVQPDPRFAWQQPLVVQPGRPVVYAKGTDFVAAVWPYPEAVSADKWQPGMVQPSRLILRDLGTVVALDPGGFYQPGDPDPYRGTGTPTGPDPHRGTSTRTIVVSN